MLDNPIALFSLWLIGAVLLGVGIGFAISDMHEEDDDTDTHELAEWIDFPPANEETDR